MNKKILALLMALLMVVMSTVAFAEDAEQFTKVYTAEGDTAVAPAATFTFNATNGKVVENSTQVEGVTAPDGSEIEITATVYGAKTEENVQINVTIDINDFPNVGIYTYDLAEAESNVAGVTTDKDTMILYVFRTNEGLAWAVKATADGAKAEEGKGLSFENTYEAGSFEFTKEVTGAYGDTNKYFEVTVTLTGEENKTYEGITMTAAGGSDESNPSTVKIGDNKFMIKHGETIKLSNLPAGVQWSIAETYVGEGYDQPKYTAENGDIATTEKDTVTITNNKDGENIDTGVNTDNMPYIMLMAFVMMIAAAVVLKKRTVNE